MNVVIDQRHGRRTLLGLAALFFVPLLLAFYLYYIGGWRPAATSEHGELISPARPLPPAQLALSDGRTVDVTTLFRGKWTLVYIGDGACGLDCQQALWTMRQARVALGKELMRVQRMFLATGNCCNREWLEREHVGMVVAEPIAPMSAAAAVPANGGALLAAFPTIDATHSLYVVDPLGNVMMRYDTRRGPKGLLEDLKKLLKLSHIG